MVHYNKRANTQHLGLNRYNFYGIYDVYCTHSVIANTGYLQGQLELITLAKKQLTYPSNDDIFTVYGFSRHDSKVEYS